MKQSNSDPTQNKVMFKLFKVKYFLFKKKKKTSLGKALNTEA